MRPRNLLILALVVVGLVAFIWFVERDLPSTEERLERAKLVLGVEAEEVTGLVVEREGAEAIRLEIERPEDEDAEDREPDAFNREWRLVEPFASRAASNRVNSLVDTIATLEKERTLDEVDAEAMGLAEPRARLTVVTADGEQRWLVGSAVPASSKMIVQREGAGEAYVVADTMWDDLAKPAGDWRSRELFDGQRSEIERLVVSHGDQSLVLGRRAGGFWLEAPLVDLADEQKVSDLLGDLVALRAEEFVDGPLTDPARLGLDPPAAVVEVVHGAAQRTFRLELGGAAEAGQEDEDAPGTAASGRYARADGQLVRISDALDEAVARDAAAWQAVGWSSFNSWQVERVVIRDAEGELELVRDGGDWLRGGQRVAYEPMSDLLYALDGAAAQRLLAPGEIELPQQPELEIVLTGEDREETLRLYAAIDEGHPAVTAGRDVALLLSIGTAEDLAMKIAEVRAADLDESEAQAEAETPE